MEEEEKEERGPTFKLSLQEDDIWWKQLIYLKE